VPLRHAAILILLCLVLFVPGQTAIPPLDRDEARFAQASKQMVETGDYVDIRFQDVPRYKKPIGAYWLQAGAAKAFSGGELTAIWAYRIPSLAAAVTAVFLTYAVAALFLSPSSALIAASLLGSSLLLTVEAHLAKTDALLLASVIAAQYGLLRAYQGRDGPGTWLVFWLAIGLGALVKGPIAPLVVAMTVITLAVSDKGAGWLKHLRPVIGIPIALAIVLPWIVAVQMRSGGAFLESSVGGDLIPKLLGGMESHGSPPGYYLALVMATFWPASLFLWPSLAAAWRGRGEVEIRFLLAWLIPTWLLFEAVPTKLPHYVLPLYPAAAILAAAWIARVVDDTHFADRSVLPRGTRVYAFLWTLVGLIRAVAVAGLAVVGNLTAPAYLLDGVELSGIEQALRDGLPALKADPLAFAPAVIAVFVAIAPVRYLRAGRPRAAAGAAVISGALFMATLAQFTLPSLDRAFLSPRIAAAVAAARANPDAPAAAVGYHEPSLVFLAGTETRLTSPQAAAALIAETPGAVASVARRHWKEFEAAAGDLQVKLKIHDNVSGLNYSTGKPVTVDIVTRESPP